jgi:DNA-binding NarL/FixJ family response regulator
LRPATVSKHLARVYARLGLTDRAAATRYWTGHQHAEHRTVPW